LEYSSTGVLGFFPLLLHSSIPILPRSEVLGAFLRWVVHGPAALNEKMRTIDDRGVVDSEGKCPYTALHEK
jgi:hypothetical protein